MTAQVMPYPAKPQSATEVHVRGGGPRVLPLMLFVVAVVAVFFSMIFLRISLDQTAFELSNLQTEIDFEQSRQLDLRYDLASLQDPLRIATEAQRIGLDYPDERVSISVNLLAVDPQVMQPEVPIRAMDGEDR